ncbi:MAG: phosphoglycolate phosphatase [Candidatus Poseidoniaceae archaeon]|jgi:phosphoglycolate phosphatase (TIGR01487 family)|tara:strand:- start:71 stop:796 length:726 start_codon:yes stop_codon:yes gene_type:complete
MQWLPEGWRPKVVAVDIDGTLTDGKKQLDTGAVESLRRLEAAGIPVVLATGNVRAITYGLWRFLNLSGPICCENGGVLWHKSWDGPIVRADGKEAKKAAEWLSEVIEGLDSGGIQTNDWRESEWCLFPDEDLAAVQQHIQASEWSHLSVVRTGFAIHLMEPHLSKGTGLEVMFEKMGWAASDLLCVGDAPNDLPMFDFAHWSVAVGGAFESVNDAADVISPFPHGATFTPLVDAILQAKEI